MRPPIRLPIRAPLAFQRQAVILDTFGAEIVRSRAEDEVVVADTVLAHQFGSVHIQQRRDDALAVLPVNALQGALEVAITPAVGTGAMANLVEVGAERSGGHLVQERLPDMRAVARGGG